MPSSTRVILAFAVLGAMAAAGCKGSTNATADASAPGSSVTVTSQIVPVPIFIGSAPADTTAQTTPPATTTNIIVTLPPAAAAPAQAPTAEQPGGAYGTGVTRGSVPSGRNTPIPDPSPIALPAPGNAGAPNVTYGGTNGQGVPTPLAPVAVPPANPAPNPAQPPVGAGAFGSGAYGGGAPALQNSPTTGGAGAGGVAPGQAFGGAGAGGAPTGQAAGGAGGGQ